MKAQIKEKLLGNSLEYSSKQIQLLEIEVKEGKEEHLREPKKGFLPLNQYYKGHYHRRKKKTKRCWVCKSRWHFKRDCPKMKCFYCGRQGHTKKKCFRLELHKALSIIKGFNGLEQNQSQEEDKKNGQKRKKKAID